MNNNQRGFGIVEGLLIIVVVGLIGLAGWVFVQRQDDKNNSPGQLTEQAQPQDQPPQVNNSEDLEKAENYLNDKDIDSQLNTTEIDQTLAE